MLIKFFIALTCPLRLLLGIGLSSYFFLPLSNNNSSSSQEKQAEVHFQVAANNIAGFCAFISCTSVRIHKVMSPSLLHCQAREILSFSIPAFYKAVKVTATLPEIKAAISDGKEDFVRELGKTKNQLRRQVHYILPGQGEETHIPKQEGLNYI